MTMGISTGEEQEGPGGIDCGTAREALSALLDGEATLCAREDLDTHVAACRGCQQWREAAQLVTRRARLTAAPSVPDNTESILAAVLADRPPVLAHRPPRGDRYIVRRLVRSGLAAAALAHGVMIVPELAGRAAVGVPVQAARELGTFNLTLAVALLAAAVRPAWARAMLPVVGVAAGFLAVLAFVDTASGYTTMRGEAPHLITVVGAVLLAVLARTFGGDPDGLSQRPLRRKALLPALRQRRLPVGLAGFVRPSARGAVRAAAHGSAPVPSVTATADAGAVSKGTGPGRRVA